MRTESEQVRAEHRMRIKTSIRDRLKGERIVKNSKLKFLNTLHLVYKMQIKARREQCTSLYCVQIFHPSFQIDSTLPTTILFVLYVCFFVALRSDFETIVTNRSVSFLNFRVSASLATFFRVVKVLCCAVKYSMIFVLLWGESCVKCQKWLLLKTPNRRRCQNMSNLSSEGLQGKYLLDCSSISSTKRRCSLNA